VATVCVFCSASDDIDERFLEQATELGRELAARGHDLVTGGGSVSSMGAVARAARERGARTIGVIPDALLYSEVADSGSSELVVTTDMRERKGVMDERSDAFVALAGGIGTLEELLEVWVARTLGLHDKPIVIVDPEDVFAPLAAQIDTLVDRGFMRAEARGVVTWVRTAEEAFDALDQEWAAGPTGTQRPTPAEVLESEP
jgi:uncharacterized protein (TIGR00730 family)